MNERMKRMTLPALALALGACLDLGTTVFNLTVKHMQEIGPMGPLVYAALPVSTVLACVCYAKWFSLMPSLATRIFSFFFFFGGGILHGLAGVWNLRQAGFL